MRAFRQVGASWLRGIDHAGAPSRPSTLFNVLEGAGIDFIGAPDGGPAAPLCCKEPPSSPRSENKRPYPRSPCDFSEPWTRRRRDFWRQLLRGDSSASFCELFDPWLWIAQSLLSVGHVSGCSQLVVMSRLPGNRPTSASFGADARRRAATPFSRGRPSSGDVGEAAGRSLRDNRKTVSGYRISNSSPLLGGHEEPEVLLILNRSPLFQRR